jgi:hypothetical protein
MEGTAEREGAPVIVAIRLVGLADLANGTTVESSSSDTSSSWSWFCMVSETATAITVGKRLERQS